ncbi:MAG TPA: peptidoglycan DD-metalloendopeptidase family protein [Bacillales bacterium]|nr:peptidoglycan DD-metalloendopeptidase family protein [Bacillales bacterium]
MDRLENGRDIMIYDFVKRFIIALIMMIFIGILMIGGKAIHAAEKDQWLWPVNGIITSEFHDRGGGHNGMDIAAPKGTSVVAARSGVVKKSYHSTSYGNVVFILHKNGYETVYAHLTKRLVSKGDRVVQGQEIGKVGSTGHSTGPHLHFEVHDGFWNIHKTNAVNPVFVIGDIGDQEVIRTGGSAVTSRDQETSENRNSQDAAPYMIRKGQLVQIGSLTREHSQDKSRQARKGIRTITVEKGDTLWGLAHQLNVTVASLKIWNHLSSDLLTIGEELKIYPDKLETYKVKSGDTLASIAEKTDASVSELIQFNHLKNNTIFPSEILITGIQ